MDLIFKLIYGFFLIFGVFSAALLLLFFLGCRLYKCRKKEINKVKPVIGKKGMPHLRPLPIRSKNLESATNRFLVYLYVPRRWQLLQNWHFIYNDKEKGEKVELVVPKGFKCDVASIPRPFRAFFYPTGLLLLPSLLHDYAFEYNQLWQVDANGDFIPYLPPDSGDDKESRKKQKRFWDDLLFEAGEQINGVWLVNKTIWWIRSLSIPTWNNYRQENNKPEKADLGGVCLCGKESPASGA